MERNIGSWEKDLICIASVGRKAVKVKQSSSSPVGKSFCLQGLGVVVPVSHWSTDVMVTSDSSLLRYDGFRGQRVVLVVVQPTWR